MELLKVTALSYMGTHPPAIPRGWLDKSNMPWTLHWELKSKDSPVNLHVEQLWSRCIDIVCMGVSVPGYVCIYGDCVVAGGSMDLLWVLAAVAGYQVTSPCEGCVETTPPQHPADLLHHSPATCLHRPHPPLGGPGTAGGSGCGLHPLSCESLYP